MKFVKDKMYAQMKKNCYQTRLELIRNDKQHR